MSDVLSQADEYHKKEDNPNAYAVLQAAYDSGNKDPEVLWRLGRVHYLLGQEFTDKAERKPHCEKGFELTKAALDAAPENWAVHKWHGILLSSMGQFQSTNEKIAQSYNIRDHWKKAIELNPTDATTYHCLGAWCWAILQISWLERQAASLLFGTPPTSSYEEAEKYLLKSHELDPKQTANTLLLGDLYYQQKKWEEAKKWYNIAADIPAITQKAMREVEDARKKAAKC